MSIKLSAADLRNRILIGWELWYCALRWSDLPGYWELRKRGETSERLDWQVIVRARHGSLPWFRTNTTEQQLGRDVCYRARQPSLLS